MSLALPLKKTRTVLFTLTTITSIIAGAAGVNAIKKSNSQKSAAKHALPADITVSISTPDIEDTVIVLFVVTNLLSMQIGNFLLMLLKDWFRPYWPPVKTHPRNGVAISTRTLGLQSWYLAANLCAILAVLIPCTIFAAHSMAHVKAFMGGVQLPDSFVQAEEAELGFAGVYWHLFPIRFVIVSNWVNFLFIMPAAVASFAALSRRKRLEKTTSGSSDGEVSSGAEEKIRSEEYIERG